MRIDSGVSESYLKALNLGCFPKEVCNFENSADGFERVAFIDYQLETASYEKFGDSELVPLKVHEFQEQGVRDELLRLASYGETIKLESQSTLVERLYYSTVMAHVYYLCGRKDDARSALKLVKLEELNVIGRSVQNDSVRYLACRYTVLRGLNSSDAFETWMRYLIHLEVAFRKSDVSGRRWYDTLCREICVTLYKKKGRELSFKEDILSLPLAKNKIVLVSFGCFLLRKPNAKLVSTSFYKEFRDVLTAELQELLKSKVNFPNANDKNHKLNSFINNIDESMSYIPHDHRPLKPTLVKKVLIHATQSTYQSEVILRYLIQTLLDLNEYDEAYAAIRTFIDYIHNDEVIEGGFDDILAVIDIYSSCIESFNPLSSFEASSEGNKKFLYVAYDDVLQTLKKYTNTLHDLLETLSDLCYIDYGGTNSEPLSFLYENYNRNITLSTQANFVKTVSRAWISIGDFYHFLSVYESTSIDDLNLNVESLLSCYKHSLIIDCHDNFTSFFQYAMALSFDRKIESATKLCKVILKKYPESFKVWNLLILLSSSSVELHEEGKPKSNLASGSGNGDILNGQTNGFVHDKNGGEDFHEAQKFVNSALNMAGIYISNCTKQKIQLTHSVKYDILQLKLTQLAIFEYFYGPNYAVEYLPEVFILFHELYDTIDETHQNGIHANGDANRKINGISTKISAEGDTKDEIKRRYSKKITPGERQHAKNKIKEMSKIRKGEPKNASNSESYKTSSKVERKILQDLWLWACKLYIKVDCLDEAEQCIIEAETVNGPNIKTSICLGYLTAKDRPRLSLQEFERAMETLSGPHHYFNREEFGQALLGMCKLYIGEDSNESIFTCEKDKYAGLVRMKNELEQYSKCWTYGYTNSEVWWYLGCIYEKTDDKTLLSESLWRCVDLEDSRPVRSYTHCYGWDF